MCSRSWNKKVTGSRKEPGLFDTKIYVIKDCCCKSCQAVSDSGRPNRWQPTRLPRPWDSPGKNTGVGCHFLLQCMKVKVTSLSRVQLFETPWTVSYQRLRPWDFPGRVLEWVAMSFSTIKDCYCCC